MRWDGENMNKSKDRNISEKKQSLKSGRRGHIKDIKITLNNTSGDPWNSLYVLLDSQSSFFIIHTFGRRSIDMPAYII